MTGNSNGSVSLFNRSKLIKTKELGGYEVHVGYFNDQIVAAVKKGSLAIMNENLQIIKKFPGTNYSVLSIHANTYYSALYDYGGLVRYYKRNSDMEPKVIFLSFQLYLHNYSELQT